MSRALRECFGMIKKISNHFSFSRTKIDLRVFLSPLKLRRYDDVMIPRESVIKMKKLFANAARVKKSTLGYFESQKQRDEVKVFYFF